MKHDHFVVQSPDTPAKQLLLLFHGVGDNAVNMGQIGSWFAPVFPRADRQHRRRGAVRSGRPAVVFRRGRDGGESSGAY